MTITENLIDQDRERQLVAWAAELGASFAGDAARHDQEGTFVAEAYETLRASGYLALAVPEELGGRGATIREVAMAQRELARHCASTALASVMHHHVVLFTAWRYRRGLPGAEATLRKVADDGIILVSTGGADQTRPRGDAVRVEGGFRVTGRKIFASQAPVGTVLSTMFAYDDPEPSMDTVAAVMAAKREIALAGVEVCSLAMDAVGGPAFSRTSPIERCTRDVRGASFHPFGPEETLLHAGRLALGRPADER